MLEFVGVARNLSKLFALNVTALRGSIQGDKVGFDGAIFSSPAIFPSLATVPWFIYHILFHPGTDFKYLKK